MRVAGWFAVLVGLLSLVPATRAAAQLPSDIIMTPCQLNLPRLPRCMPALRYRVTPNGFVSTMFGGARRYAQANDALNRGYLCITTAGVAVYDPLGRPIGAPISMGGSVQNVDVDQSGGPVAALGVPQALVRSEFGGVTTIVVALYPRYLGRDLFTGNYVMTSSQSGGALFVSRQGVIVSTLSAQTTVRDAAQDERDGSWWLLTPTGVVRQSAQGQTTIATFNAFYDLVVDVPGVPSPFIASEWGRLIRIDRQGNVTPVTFAYAGRDLLTDRTRHLASVQRGSRAAPNFYDLVVSFPNEVNGLYAVGLSVTGFTGGAFVQGRRLPITVDAVTALGLAGRLAPLWTNGVGRLDGNGEGRATLDLRSLGNVVRGLRVWAVAVSFDLAGRLQTVARPIVIVMD